MNLRRKNLVRDLFFLSLPVAGLLVYLVLAAITGFWNAEVRNFSGYPVRGLRVASLSEFVRDATRPLLDPRPRDWRPDSVFREERGSIPTIDLRVAGLSLDHLDSALPASGKEWVAAELRSGEGFQEVVARHRGQRLDNYFWGVRSWKLKTGKREMVGFQRDLNYTPLEGRLDNHLSNLVGRRLGVPTPESRLVHFFLNREDQGIFLQEEQVDESFMRRVGHMPGDVFYGDLFVPEEPERGTDDLFCNPYLWFKKSRYNRYPEAFRPHLVELLDRISDLDPSSFDALYALCDYDELVRFFALLTYQGDQHLDRSHNHKLFFEPITGRFLAIPWNVRMNMPRGQGLESTANRFAEKLGLDPRFLDDVHRVIADELLSPKGTRGTMEDEQLAEIAELRRQVREHSVDPHKDLDYLAAMEETVRARAATVRAFHASAELRFSEQPRAEQPRAVQPGAAATGLDLFATGVASLRLRALDFSSPPGAVHLYEDRDFDGQVGEGDREIALRVEGTRAVVETADALLPAGRDRRAPYHLLGEETRASFQLHRQFTRPAYLRSPFLLVAEGGAPVALASVEAERTVGAGAVSVVRGAPADPLDTESLHPWRRVAPPAPVVVRWSGTVELRESLELSARDRLEVEPGTKLLLGPAVNVLLRCHVEIERLTVRRLEADRPWGVFALQGVGASCSRLLDCDMSGGSESRIGFVDYTGMLSIFGAHGVEVRGGRYASNVVGDDTIRFARCHDLHVDGVTVADANGDAIDCDLSSGTIERTFLDRPRNDGVDLMTSRVALTDLVVIGSGDKGVSLGEGASPFIRRARIEGCVTGIGIKDGSDPRIEDSTFTGCETAIGAYDKNWRYQGGGRGRLVRCRFADNQVDLKLDSASFVQLEDTTPSGKVILPPGPEELWLERRTGSGRSDP